jgi:hypothetical protein
MATVYELSNRLYCLLLSSYSQILLIATAAVPFNLLILRQKKILKVRFSLDNLGPINCLWSGFGAWSRCSVSCGSGTEQRKRMVLQPARNGGQECIGDTVETRSCSQPSCPSKISSFKMGWHPPGDGPETIIWTTFRFLKST